jgi:site-specific DNA recombinase
MIRAALYARISDDRTGAGLGVERQLQDCRRICVERGWQVAEEYVDNDRSAYQGKPRADFDRLQRDVEAGQFDAIVTYHQDRLTRTPMEFEQFLGNCQTNGVQKLVTVTGLTDLTQDDSIMVARIFAAVAANESDAKSRRIRRANDQRAAQGLPHVSGERPYGYERDGMTVIEKEAAVIRTVARRFLAGESLNGIAESLSQQGITTSTGMNEWKTQTLRGMLLSPRNAGLRVHRGEVAGPAAWPAILPMKQHEQLVTKFADPARRTTRTPRRYLLSGMVRCGLCNGKMVSAPDSGRRRYGCRSGIDFGHGCGKVYVAAEALDLFIADAVLYRLDTPDLANALAGRGADNVEQADLQDQVRDDSEQLDELTAAYAAKQITMHEWLGARKSIEARLETSKRQLARLNRNDALAGLAGTGHQLRDHWDSPEMGLSRQAAIVAAVIEHVIVNPAQRKSNRFDHQRVVPVWRT